MKNCPHCNRLVAEDNNECPVCGKPLNEDAVTAAPQPEPIETTEQSEAGGAEAAPEAVEPAADPAAAAPTVEAEAAAPQADVIPSAQPEMDPTVPEPKNGKKKWIIPAAIAAVVVVAAGAFAVTSLRQKDPKDIVLDAFKSITAEGQTDPAEELLHLSKISELNTESSQGSLEFTYDGSSIAEANAAQTATLGMDFLNDMENNNMSAEIRAGFGGMDIARFQMYLDDTQFVMAIPELSSKAIMLNYGENLDEQLEASPFLGPLLQDSGMNLEGFNNYMKKAQEIAATGDPIINLPELWNRYKEGSQAIDDLKAAMTVEKIDSKKVTIDGAEVDADGYHVVVTKDALLQFADATKDFMLSDETLKQEFIEYAQLIAELQGTMTSMYGYEEQTPESMQQEVWDEINEQYDIIMDGLEESMGDVTMDVYVRKDGKMAQFSYETILTADGDEVEVYGDVNFTGGYNMLSNVNGTLNIEGLVGTVTDKVTLTFDKTGTYEAGAAWDGRLVASIGNGIDTYGMVYEGNYTAEGNTYDIDVEFLNGDKIVLALTSNGTIKTNADEKTMELLMDSLRIETNALTGRADYVEFSGLYTVGPLTDEVEMPEGDLFDILAATEEEFDALGNEIVGKYMGLMMQFYQ